MEIVYLDFTSEKAALVTYKNKSVIVMNSKLKGTHEEKKIIDELLRGKNNVRYILKKIKSGFRVRR